MRIDKGNILFLVMGVEWYILLQVAVMVYQVEIK